MVSIQVFILLFFIFFGKFEHFHNEKQNKNPILLHPETRSVSRDRMFVPLGKPTTEDNKLKVQIQPKPPGMQAQSALPRSGLESTVPDL